MGGSHGEENAEGGALAGVGFYFDLALVCFNNHAALEHAYAHALFLSGLKGAEEATFDKLGAHAAAVIGDGQDYPTVRLAGFNSNAADRTDGIPGVEKEVGDDVAHLGGVHSQPGEGTKLFYELDLRRGVQAFKRFGD